MSKPKGEKLPSLTEVCLTTITSNFGRYYAVFRDFQSCVPWDHWLFLARRFSETVFTRLKLERKLKSEYLDFLINPYVKELDIRELDKNLLPDLVHRLQSHGKNVLSFNASPYDLGEKEVYEPLLASLPNVESISFSYVPQSEIFEVIGSNCAFLKALKIRRYGSLMFRDAEYRAISSVIKRCSCLEDLQHPDSIGVLYSMHKNDVLLERKTEEGALKEYSKYMLTSLSSKYGDYPLVDALGICSVICPCVTHLCLAELKSNEELQEITGFSLLQQIKIKDISDGITKSCFDQFLKSIGSRLLSLDMPPASCLSLATLIEFCPTLQSLKLQQYVIETGLTVSQENWFQTTRLTLEDVESRKDIARLLNLKTIEMPKFNFNDTTAAGILKLLLSVAKNVTSLSLFESRGLTHEFLESLNLRGVHELDVRGSDIGVDSLKNLLPHSSIRSLNVTDCDNIFESDYTHLTEHLLNEKANVINIKWE